MLFNSIEFAFFFPVVTALFFLLPHRQRWLLLLLASCFFYMFFRPVYIFILFFTILIDYFAGIFIADAETGKTKKALLFLSIIANVSVLVVFKYFNFLSETINQAFSFFHVGYSLPILDIILPIGLSFHTFQAMSYTIEVYRGNQQPERHLGIYALYVMFYPQLVAGPIERPQNLLHQFHEKKYFNYENMRRGLVLITWGLIKKVVIADRLALFVNPVYNDVRAYSGIPLILATVFFAFQIFCDFSGYSDIAIGTAKCMGFNLMVNFNRPYQSTSIREFWTRWHISLSSWFRDYVYIPLGGNRVSDLRHYAILLLVFLLSGIWHGANYTFLIWGLLNGLYLVTENILHKKYPVLKVKRSWMPRLFQRLSIFMLISFAWIFFRAPNLSDAAYVVTHLFKNIPEQIRAIISNQHFERLSFLYMNQPGWQFYLAFLLLAIMFSIHWVQGKDTFDGWLVKKKTSMRWSVYYSMILTFILFGVFNRSGFIYFQF